MKRTLAALFVSLVLLVANAAFGQSVWVYVIIANINDEKLVLADRYGNTHVVEAQTYCFGFDWEKGNVVLSTSNLFACASATLVSPTTGNTCKIWCF